VSILTKIPLQSRRLYQAVRAALAAAPLLSGLAVAQDVASHDPAADFALAHPLIPTLQSQPPSTKDFTIILTVPFLATNNAVGAIGETGGSGKPNFHINPDLMVRWTHQYDVVRLSAYADVGLDRYSTAADLNGNTLTGGAKIALTDGKSDVFVPYVSYTAMYDYEPGFAARNDAFHTFAVGFASGIGISARGGIIPFRNSTEVGDWSIAFDVSTGRRFAAPADFENVFALIAVDVVYNIADHVVLGLLSRLRGRDYPDYYGVNRRDVFAAIQARVEWTPDWLTSRLPGAELDFTVEYQNNRSNVPGVRYSRWEGGPALTLKQRF
jgi:hypothetical protein